MKTIAIEDIMIGVILTFCENAAELGCPQDKDVDIWFREMCNDKSPEEIRALMNKVIDIQERDTEMYKEEKQPEIKEEMQPRPSISNISVSFIQDGNTLGTTDDIEKITIEAQFQLSDVDGPFYVIKTDGWSMDNLEDMKKMLRIVEAPVEKIKEQFPSNKYYSH